MIESKGSIIRVRSENNFCSMCGQRPIYSSKRGEKLFTACLSCGHTQIIEKSYVDPSLTYHDLDDSLDKAITTPRILKE